MRHYSDALLSQETIFSTVYVMIHVKYSKNINGNPSLPRIRGYTRGHLTFAEEWAIIQGDYYARGITVI